MLKKFKVELIVMLETDEFEEEDMSFTAYIEQELGWTQQSFQGYSVLKIEEVK